jgi:hypothetical protein
MAPIQKLICHQKPKILCQTPFKMVLLPIYCNQQEIVLLLSCTIILRNYFSKFYLKRRI